MANVNEIATELNKNEKDLSKKAKDKIFDVIAVGLILCVSLLSLGAVQLRELTFLNFINMLLEAVPFYMSAVTLSINYYKKGVFSGKRDEGYKSAISTYSRRVNKMTGKQLDFLGDFCDYYNDKALKSIQKNALRGIGISYEHYNDYRYDAQGHKLKPLKLLSESELAKEFNEDMAKKIFEIRNLKIKGLNANSLLGIVDNSDVTDLGMTEKEFLEKRTKSYVISNVFTIIILTIITIKNLSEWGWVAFILLGFKLLFIVSRCYMKYFEGYDDITQGVTNYTSRKIDILKQFDYWYFNMYPSEIDVEDEDNIWLSNISDKSIIYYNKEGCKTGDDGNSPKNVEGVLNER